MKKRSMFCSESLQSHSVVEPAKEKYQLTDDYTTPGRGLRTYSGPSLIRQRMLLIPSLPFPSCYLTLPTSCWTSPYFILGCSRQRSIAHRCEPEIRLCFTAHNLMSLDFYGSTCVLRTKFLNQRQRSQSFPTS